MKEQIELMSALIVEQRQIVYTIDRKYSEDTAREYREQLHKLSVMEDILNSLFRLKSLE